MSCKSSLTSAHKHQFYMKVPCHGNAVLRISWRNRERENDETPSEKKESVPTSDDRHSQARAGQARVQKRGACLWATGAAPSMPRRHSEGLLAQRVISDGMLRIWLNEGKRALSAHVSVEALFPRGSNTLTGLTVTRLLFHALSRTSDVSIAGTSAVTKLPVSRMLRTTWPSLRRMCCLNQYAELGVAGACPIPGPPNLLHQTTTLQTRVHMTCWTHAERKGAAIETKHNLSRETK